MRFRLLAFALAVVAGVTVPLAVAPVPASAIVQTIDPIGHDGITPGGWSQANFDYYIKKMTQPRDPTKPRKFYPLTPSDSKFRAYMISTLGSVLGAATPDKWAREQMANQNKYNFSWEKMEQDIHNGSATGAPQTYEDYVLDKKDWKSKNEDKVPRNVGRAPATKAAPMGKGIDKVAGGLMALTGMPIGFMLVDGAMQMQGYDKEGQLCAGTSELVQRMVGIFNGVDCDAWKMTQQAIAEANSDVAEGLSLNACGTKNQIQTCWRWNGVSTITGTERYPYYGWCGVASGPRDAQGRIVSSGITFTVEYQGGSRASLPQYVAPGTEWAFGSCGVGGDVMEGGAAPAGSIPKPITRVWISGNDGPPMAAIHPVEAESDPERTLGCEVTGSDGKKYSQHALDTYAESHGVIKPPECPDLPEGVTPRNIGISDNLGNKMYEQPVTQPYKDWTDENPDCTDGSCPLDLLVISNDGTDNASCFDLGLGCKGWFQSADRDTRFECRHGGKKRDLKECYVYADLFNTEKIAVGSPYSDPETGVWTGGKNSTNTLGKGAMGMPIQNPDMMRNCLEQGWTDVNPIEWVMVPVDCALQKAFVPRTAVVELAGVGAAGALNGRAPGQLATIAAGWEFKPAMTGCKKTVTLPAPFPGSPPTTTDVWNACPGGPHETLGLWSRWISALAFGVMVVMLVRRHIAGTVDYKGN